MSFPPRTLTGAISYCIALGVSYAAFTAVVERYRAA